MSAVGTTMHATEGQRRAASAIVRARAAVDNKGAIGLTPGGAAEQALIAALGADIDFLRAELQQIALNSFEVFARTRAEAALRAQAPAARSAS